MPAFTNFLPFLPAIVVFDRNNPSQFQQWVGSIERGFTRAITYSLSTTATPQLTAITQQIFSEVASFANVTFVQTANQPELTDLSDYFDRPGQVADRNPDIRISMQTYPAPQGQGGFAQFGWWYNGNNELIDIDSFALIWVDNHYTVIHELGHTLGLEHTSPIQDPRDFPDLPVEFQNNNYSVMHYELNGIFSASEGEWDYRHFQLYDVYALQQRFGVNTTTYAGSDTHTAATLGVDQWLQVLWDASGTDTIDMSAQTRGQLIDIRSGGFNNIGSIAGNNPSGYNLAIAIGAVIENATGGSGSDTIFGTAAANVLSGGAGSDTITGGGGIDQLFGGSGNDLLILGSGASGSTVDGGADTDTLAVSSTLASLVGLVSIEALEFGGGAGLTLTGTQFANGLAKTSAVSGTGSLTVNMNVGIEFLSQSFAFSGGGVTVTVNGTSGTDIIKSGAGVHIINAGDGADQIRGGTSADTINGGAGNDKIIGFTGADIITGGTGNDQFRYLFLTDSGLGANADRITDFAIGGDILNFSLIDANAATAGDQAFSFIGTGAFAATGVGQIRYQNSGADLLVQADVNGDGIVDMEIILQGLSGGTLTAADFIL